MYYFPLKNLKKMAKKSSLTDEEIEIWSTAAQGWDSNPVLQTHLLIQQHTTVSFCWVLGMQ